MTRKPAGLPAALLAALLAGLLTALTACGSGGSEAGAEGATTLTGIKHEPYRVADTALTTTSGEPFSLTEDTTEPLTLLFFGYTHCPTECPIVMNTIAAAMPRLSEEDRAAVEVVFVTTDPARDDRRTLRAYLDRYGKDFVGLTGDLGTIAKVARSVKMYVAQGEKLPSGGYDLRTHSTRITGIEENGATIVWDMETTPAQLAADIHTLLEENRA